MFRLASLIVLLITSSPLAKSWGFFGHKTINHAAVFMLPNEMFGFYKTNINQIVELAVNADKRRYILESEAPRHYLDADFYESQVPLDTLPKQFDSAVTRYGLDTILSHGIVPWHVIKVKWWLTKAFMQGDVASIIRLSADLGHYVGDLHVPLHSTHNYNGQYTDQHGIHGFWESRLPELFIGDYDLFVGKAEYIEDLHTTVWARFEESFAAKDSVLQFDIMVRSKIREDQQFSFEQRGQQTIKTYSKKYSVAYHYALNNMVERRMRSSIYLVGCLWFTAWVDAGQPNLDALLLHDSSVIMDSLPDSGKFIGREEPQ
ncbi:MAG: hypothetical protein ACI9UJ_001266 [bacterium]|jgi:hypothetical protein